MPSSSPLPTDGELAILQVLWDRGPSTVREVNDLLQTDRPVGYTTTLKLLQIMVQKGLVSRDTSGRTHIYQAVVHRESTRKALLDRFLDNAFAGAAGEMILQLLGRHRTTPEELARIKDLIDQSNPQPDRDGTLSLISLYREATSWARLCSTACGKVLLSHCSSRWDSTFCPRQPIDKESYWLRPVYTSWEHPLSSPSGIFLPRPA